MTARLRIVIATLFIAFIGLSFGCRSVEETATCAGVCARYGECIDDELDVDACTATVCRAPSSAASRSAATWSPRFPDVPKRQTGAASDPAAGRADLKLGTPPPNQPAMRVDYVAQPSGRSPVTFTIDTDRAASGRGTHTSATGLPVWTELTTHKCEGCALGPEATHCPAAADLLPVVDALRDLRSIERTEVTVTIAGREVRRETDLQELVRSVVGVVLASSACPTLRTMKPLADLHQPFATFEETQLGALRTLVAAGAASAPDTHAAAAT